jgi:hypothetical protein
MPAGPALCTVVCAHAPGSPARSTTQLCAVRALLLTLMPQHPPLPPLPLDPSHPTHPLLDPAGGGLPGHRPPRVHLHRPGGHRRHKGRDLPHRDVRRDHHPRLHAHVPHEQEDQGARRQDGAVRCGLGLPGRWDVWWVGRGVQGAAVRWALGARARVHCVLCTVALWHFALRLWTALCTVALCGRDCGVLGGWVWLGGCGWVGVAGWVWLAPAGSTAVVPVRCVALRECELANGALC